MKTLKIIINPKSTYYKYEQLWNSLIKLLEIQIIPFDDDHIKNIQNSYEKHIVFDFNNNSDKSSDNSEKIIFDNLLSRINPILIENLSEKESQLFDIIQKITNLQNQKSTSKACIIIDDPTLYSFKYGYVNYKRLVASCKEYGVHCCIAIVPIDTWAFNSNLIRFFHENNKYISLCMHGVFHLNNDLNREWQLNDCISYLNYGMKFIKRFEKKTGLRVSRLMVPPHEKLSKIMAEAISHTEIRGIITGGKVYGYTKDISAGDYLAGMYSEYWVFEKVAILQRESLASCTNISNDELKEKIRRRALLNQPVLFESHHCDFKATKKIIKRAGEFINTLGIEWAPLLEIENDIFTNKNFETEPILEDIKNTGINPLLIITSFLRRWACMLRDWAQSKR